MKSSGLMKSTRMIWQTGRRSMTPKSLSPRRNTMMMMTLSLRSQKASARTNQQRRRRSRKAKAKVKNENMILPFLST